MVFVLTPAGKAISSVYESSQLGSKFVDCIWRKWGARKVKLASDNGLLRKESGHMDTLKLALNMI